MNLFIIIMIETLIKHFDNAVSWSYWWLKLSDPPSPPCYLGDSCGRQLRQEAVSGRGPSSPGRGGTPASMHSLSSSPSLLLWLLRLRGRAASRNQAHPEEMRQGRRVYPRVPPPPPRLLRPSASDAELGSDLGWTVRCRRGTFRREDTTRQNPPRTRPAIQPRSSRTPHPSTPLP